MYRSTFICTSQVLASTPRHSPVPTARRETLTFLLSIYLKKQPLDYEALFVNNQILNEIAFLFVHMNSFDKQQCTPKLNTFSTSDSNIALPTEIAKGFYLICNSLK